MIVFIRGAKGKKDRISLLSEATATIMRVYLKKYSPNYWMFESPDRKQYSGTSIGNILKKAVEKANNTKKVTPHVLRQSFATHLLEQGVDIRYIQELLGHKSSRTTEIYTHVSIKSLRNIKNPFNDFDIYAQYEHTQQILHSGFGKVEQINKLPTSLKKDTADNLLHKDRKNKRDNE